MPKSTKSFLFPDINVWVALTYSAHEHHFIAANWFNSLDSQSTVCFCRFTQIGLMRLLTTAAVMGTDEVMTQEQAWRAYDIFLTDERVVFLAEPPDIEGAFRDLSTAKKSTPKNWSDAYLAAFANTTDMTIVTFDGGFRGRADHLLLLGN